MKSPVMRTNAQSGAIVRFNEDGSITVYTGSVEIGQGVNTILSQIAAETLSIPIEMVHYSSRVDTDYSPHEWQTVASHTTWAVGNAVLMAAQDALDQIKAAAAQVLEVPPEELETRDAKVYPKGQSQSAIPYAKFATGYRLPNGAALNPPVIGRGSFVPQGLTFPDPDTGQGNLAASWTFGCQAAEVEVDLETGQITVLRLISAQDAGRIVNPDTARGQIEGAMIMALGAALMEKLHFDSDGRIQNHNLVDYRIITTTDTPRMEVIFIETEDASGPYGARGLGEHGIVAIPAAIANALADALGIEFKEIPITSEMVFEAIEKSTRVVQAR
jgi:carbon-monoxide dehydrogenase large subunit